MCCIAPLSLQPKADGRTLETPKSSICLTWTVLAASIPLPSLPQDQVDDHVAQTLAASPADMEMEREATNSVCLNSIVSMFGNIDCYKCCDWCGISIYGHDWLPDWFYVRKTNPARWAGHVYSAITTAPSSSAIRCSSGYRESMYSRRFARISACLCNSCDS